MAIDQKTSDDLRWKLSGIRAELGQIEERRKYLVEQEANLTGTGLLGTATATKGKTVKKPLKRQRTISEETRQKMREAAARRFGPNRKQKNPPAATVQTSQTAVGTPIPPPLDTPAVGM
jgi:hypothetical protein